MTPKNNRIPKISDTDETPQLIRGDRPYCAADIQVERSLGNLPGPDGKPMRQALTRSKCDWQFGIWYGDALDLDNDCDTIDVGERCSIVFCTALLGAPYFFNLS